MNKQRELIIGLCVTIAVLVSAALFPLGFANSFMPAVDPESPGASQSIGINNAEFGKLGRNERNELYHNGIHTSHSDGPEASLDVGELGISDNQMLAISERFEAMVDILLIDKNINSTLFYRYYTVEDGDNNALRYLELYCDWTSDWRSWFKIHIDIDTAEIYYLNYSAECLSNKEQYKKIDRYDSVSLLENITGMVISNNPEEVVSVSNDGAKTYKYVLTDSIGEAVYHCELRYFPAAMINFDAKIQYSDKNLKLLPYTISES